MAEHVISHQQPRRKRGARRPVLRRFGALTVTIAALGAASWLAPRFYEPEPSRPIRMTEAPLKRPPAAADIKEFGLLQAVAASAAPASATPAAAEAPRPRRARRSGVPLDARPAEMAEDFEILSAAELDAISQARN